MVAAAVVAFAIVLPDQLPVAVFDDRALERDLGVSQPMRGEIGLDAVAEGREVGRLLGEANPDIAADALAMHRLQPMRLGVEFRAHVAGVAKPPVEFISPVVIGADELDDASLRRRANPRAAVAAGVVESADRAVVRTHDHDRIFADLQGEEGAGRGELAIVACEQPFAIKDRVQIELKEARIGIEFSWEGMPRTTALQLGQHFRLRVHLRIPCDYRSRESSHST